MKTDAVKGGARRWRAVQVGGGAVALAGLLLAWPNLHRLPLPSTALHSDIHAEHVKFASGRDTITAYLAYPERAERAPAVVVIHEIFGMSDFIRQTTEQLAKDGFVAIAPDLLSRRGGTPPSPDSARKLIAGLAPDTVTQDLDATVAYVRRVKAVRADRVGVIGFCWGGGQSFRYATNNPSLSGFVVCYGPGPEALAVARIRARGGWLPARRSSTVGTTSRSGFTPIPAYSVPSANEWRVTGSCTPQFLGSAKVAISPTLPADGSPMITPRPVARKAARRSSAAPEVPLDASSVMGPA